MKIVIAPDKFKGSLSSSQACKAIEQGIHLHDKSIQTQVFPMADGGDGFAEVVKYYVNTSTRIVASVDAIGRPLQSSYEWDDRTQTAIIELATCSGMAALEKEHRNPLHTSTYGTGIQVQHAINNRAKRIMLGLGGSATNDAGTGILAAMGFRFLDADGMLVSPNGEGLLQIEQIIPPASLPTVQIELATDVNNPLHGENGAAYIFSPQKGADLSQVRYLDEGLHHFSTLIKKYKGIDIASVPGVGAAGGVAAGLLPFFQARIIKGVDEIIRLSGIETAIADADIIITGEGKLDYQSFSGKTISAITSLAARMNIPCVAICGKLELTEKEWQKLGLNSAIEIADESLTLEQNMLRATDLLRTKVHSMMHTF